jgi:hypothetical protein
MDKKWLLLLERVSGVKDPLWVRIELDEFCRIDSSKHVIRDQVFFRPSGNPLVSSVRSSGFRLSKVTRRIFRSDWFRRIDDGPRPWCSGDDGIESSENEDENRSDSLRIGKKRGSTKTSHQKVSLYLQQVLYFTFVFHAAAFKVSKPVYSCSGT